MKAKLDAEDITLIKLAKEYQKESKARALFESWRWPNGPVCPHCQNHKDKPISKLKSAKDTRNKLRAGVYFCSACRKNFTATVGTVLEDSHVPLSQWMMAFFILCNAKKSVSAHQLHRMLGVTYKTAWFMAQRIRFAMATDFKTAKPLTGVVEADETFVGGKTDMRRSRQNKSILGAIVQRDGEVRTRVLPTVTQKNVGKFLNQCVSKDAIVNTDEHGAYRGPAREYKRHDRVVHSRFEYSRNLPDGGRASINNCESFFSLIKRGVFGSWHCVSPEHLAKHASEFEYRWNTRKLTDGERMARFVPMITDKRLFYRKPAN